MALCALLFGISTSTTLKGEPANKSNTVLLEPETFRACGGWEVIDGQDGTTEIFVKATNTGGTALAGFNITAAGTYTIWANTRDYDTSPGSRRFKVLVDGQEPDIECGAHGVNGWRWEQVKVIPLTSGTHTIEVMDTAQYLGRLEAVLVTSAGLDPNAAERASLNTYRQTPLQAARVPVQSPGLENPTVTEGAAGVAAELRTRDMALRFRKARTVDGQDFLLREIEFLTGDAATLSWRGNAEPVYLIRAAESTVRPGWAPRWKSVEFEDWTLNGGTWTLPADTRNAFLAGDARAAYLPDSVAQVIDAKTIKILYKLRQGAVVTGFPDEITVTWQVPESGHAARMEVSMTTVQSGFYSLAFAATGAGGISFDKVTAVQLPPLYQFKRLPDVPVMIMSSMAPHPMSLVETSEISGMPALTHGVVADPDRLPSEWAERDNATHGFSLLGAELAAQPVVFSPVLGGHNSQKNNGDTLNAAWWVVTAPQPWFETMRDTDTGILRLRDYREPWNTSLTEQAINIIKLIKSGPQFRWYDNLKGPSNIESRSTATHSAPLMLVSAARLTRDDEFYKTRGLPTLEFMLSRSSAHFALSTDQTYVKRPEDIRLSFLRSSFYGTALWQGFDNLLGGLNPWLRDYMMNGTNVVTAGGQVPAWSEKLALHRSMPDIALLNTIKAEAKTWAATQFGNTTANQTPRDISYFYNVSFYPYWWDLLDLYELTGDAEILAYARQGASLTTAGQWVTPIVPADPAANLTLYAGGTLSVTRTIWWDGDERKRIGFPPNHPPGTPATFNIPEKNVPAWLPATTGLGLEQPSTYFTPNGLNNIQLAVWAANLMRLHSITGEDYWRTHARNAIIGRGSSYPGYYLSLYSDLQYDPGYAENGPDITSLYWHHAPVHLAMLVDFLVTDADARTGGAIRFPYVKSQGYVWFSSRIYGGSPGRIFDDPACWLWLDNQKFNVDTPKVDHIAARSENRFHLVLMNQARGNTTARVFVDKAALGIALPASASLRDANGNASTLAPDADDKFTVTLAQGGLAVLTFDAARETMEPDAPALSEKPIVANIDATWEDLHAFRIRSPHGADSLYVALSGIPDDGKMTLLFVDASGGTRAVATKDTAPFELTADDISYGDVVRFKVQLEQTGGAAVTTQLFTLNGTKPANPSGLNATNMDNGGALLKWPSAPGAVTYNIKRATTPGGPFQKIAQIAASPDATIIEYTDATNLTDGQDYYYVISASNAYGESFDSAHARVDISNAAAPQITTQPLSQNAECGASVTLSVTTPESGVTYQWLKDGQAIAGATSATLTLAGIPADSGSYQVRITGQNGVTLSTAATLTIVPSQTGAHGTPAALTVDASGIVYVSDEEKNVIHTLTPPGSTNVYVNVFAGAPGESGALDGTGTNARLNRPVGITVRSGTLYVADSGNARLRTISAGREVKTHPAIISGELTAIATDPAGNIYAADKSAHVIRKIEAATGNPVIIAGQLNTSGTLDGSGTAAQFNAPAGIAHAAGILYVADTGNHTIRKIDLANNNSVATHAGCATAHGSVDGHRDDALFNHPEGLIVDGDGTLYVADSGNSTIREITAGGYVNTLAGNPGADGVTGIAGFKDATGTNALFNHPRDLALGNNGEYLYVADSGNRAIRRIDSANKVQTMTAIVSSGTSTNPGQPENPDDENKGGGGGGGAPSTWYLAAALALLATMRIRRG